MYIYLKFNKMVAAIAHGDKPCLLEKMRQEQAKLPPEQRTNAFYINCPCKKCNPLKDALINGSAEIQKNNYART